MEQREITIYVKARCRRCWRAKRLFRRKRYHFEVLDVTDDARLRARFAHLTGPGTEVPYVFVDHRPVGSLATLRALERSGDLDRLVRGEV